MKHIVFDYEDTKNYNRAIVKSQNKKYTSQLIQIYTALTKKKKIQKILNDISKKFSKAVIIGSTTAGEISHAKIYENSTLISLSLFEETTLLCSYVKNIDRASGEKISSSICTKNTKAAIIISEGLKGNDYEGFIKNVKNKNSKLIISGGLAGDNFHLKKTLVFLNKNIYTKGAVGVSFSGKNLFADNRYNLNWTPIGKEFTITKVKDNIVHEIDNKSAKKLFLKYLGGNIFANNATELPNFQFLYKVGETTVSRTPLALDKESIVFAGRIKKGQKVQFGFSNANSLISGAQSINRAISKNSAEAIYIFSCIVRKTLLGKVLEKEFEAFENIAPSAGFFTYGEYYSTSEENALLNCSTTILVLSEQKKRKKKKRKTQKINLHNTDNSTFSALTHFVKQTSKELNENTRLLSQYKAVVDKSSLVSKTDNKGKITYVNKNFCKASQYTEAELLGRNHNIIRDKNVSDFIFKKMWFNLNQGKVWRGLISNRAKDGSIYYVDATIMPILDQKGEIEEFIAIRQDVTKQISSKQRIIEKEKLIKAIFDNQESIVILASLVTGMISVNRKLFYYFDYKDFEDFKNQNSCICDLFLEEEGYINKVANPEWLSHVLNNSQEDHKVKMIIKDGSVHTFSIIITKIEEQYIINLSDITKLENALLKAHSSEQAKSMFLSNMSHEIRTPLNGILGFTDILTKKELDKDSKRYIDIIKKSGQTLLHVVNDILDFSKIESGELSISEVESNLFSEMEATVSTFASVAKNKSIDYFVYIDPKIPKSLKSDTQRIKQVVNNLLSNAMKFTPKNGNVYINITKTGSSRGKAEIEFKIKDSGIGIAKEKLPTIFKAFSQADNSISREFGGTGLGLAISNQYINMMGSSIIVKSTEGEGSTFSFTLHLEILNATESLVKQKSNAEINISILYAQDEKLCSINNIVSTYLEAWSYNYTELKSIGELDDTTDILIVCAQLFDKEACVKALNKIKGLHLLYIEGTEDSFDCTHKKFHLIEQPMTGSSLFDKLITLTTDDVSQTIEEEESPSPKYKGNILIAEDNETNQMLVTLMLQERGIHYTVVENGQEAIDEIAQNDHYDLILMDINMPILDGVSATKELRKFAYTKPIVSLSANVIESDTDSFKAAGMNETLNKPIIPEELDKILTKYLKNAEEIEFDEVDIEKISKELSIPNNTIILKLLKSFASSTQKILEKLQLEDINKDLIHNLKGMSGNLRFNRLYEFTRLLEELPTDELDSHKESLILYLQEILKQISLIDK